MPIIEIKNLSKQYQLHRKKAGLMATLGSLFYKKKHYVDAVRDVSFEVGEGEVVGFLGPNGAGKTTILKMLSGILYPTAGKILVQGFIPQDRKKEFRKQFGIVMGQKDQLERVLPPMDNFLLFKEFYEIPDQKFKSSLDELVTLLGVEKFLDVPVRKLSLGERMKCELIASLLHDPRVLFLDEPTIGLDVVAQRNIRDFIRDYNRKKKTTIILTSHYMEDIKELCDRVVIINHGSIIYDGGLKQLISRYANDKIIKITTLKKIPREFLERYGVVEEFNDIGASLRVPRESVKKVAAQIISSDLAVDDILIDEVSVTEIIRAIFEDK